jgi:OOP family OmpA-OmpF porin
MELTGLFTLAIAAALAWPRAEVPRQRIVLLPSADGSPSAVVVKGADGERLLNTPFAGLEVMANGSIQTVALTEAEVRTWYAQVLEAQPPRPQSFLLYFVTGSDSQLTSESAQTVRACSLSCNHALPPK